MRYSHLFTPLKFSHWQLNNRVIMGSMHTNLEESENGFEKLARFYQERVAGGVGLIITGGIAPNHSGALTAHQALMQTEQDAQNHKVVTHRVHQAGGLICMQILHAGRYGYHPNIVAPSAIQAPISPFLPAELTEIQIEQQIADFVNSAKLAQQAGYDGVEIMGSEGYLINQFLVARTNKRTDNWGGSFINRCRFALEIVSQIRQQLGDKFIIIYRLSMLDLVEQGSSIDEVVSLAKQIEQAGANILNSGIGWHEARIPTIAAMVPRATFTKMSKQIKQQVNIPVVTCNRINMPDTAEQVLAEGDADLISMARPFLADSDWINKAKNGQTHLINTCIACNQACLDHVFEGKLASCLVNPRAAHETELNFTLTAQPKKLAVVGAGPAGMAFSIYAAQRGHQVSLFEAQPRLGGQLNLAKQIPGKSEFYEMLRYFKNQLIENKVNIKLNHIATPADFNEFDEVIVATGVVPRQVDFPGADSDSVVSYLDILTGKTQPADAVAIIGAGGIGFDIAEYVCHFADKAENPIQVNIKPQDDSKVQQSGVLSAKETNLVDEFTDKWGIDLNLSVRSGLGKAKVEKSAKTIFLLQRKTDKVGAGLAKTTGWIHKMELKQQGVAMLSGVEYKKFDHQGLHINCNGEAQILPVKQVIVCAGQESLAELASQINDKPVHIIGGAYLANQLDAKNAIKQAAVLAAKI
ncbi:NADPH-dependent 2,4-dienoyl-CoA reductase [Catenovulum sp. 2E275]|uniref:NADPH-dependent 2,4-dienoyl-CoA reductase n=1 Tax=Catenovulum sp. 2E275 TaxID=2980497 RepID=UPI0021D0F883|nr:NADPH-dependent 2,4-dienoyl-CoA reductase [Catenovulum sp. 2E275]MCU4676847.1 NADPH-dependent 2,4-dienoyl-CoA reductase [Catenovulum sp. 2E275]